MQEPLLPLQVKSRSGSREGIGGNMYMKGSNVTLFPAAFGVAVGDTFDDGGWCSPCSESSAITIYLTELTPSVRPLPGLLHCITTTGTQQSQLYLKD
jgi:hypothetical protein